MSTRFPDKSEKPRVAVTGFYANYLVKRENDFAAHRFRSSEGPSLRAAFEHDISEGIVAGWEVDRRIHPVLEIDWTKYRTHNEMRQLKLSNLDFKLCAIRELRHLKLWNGDYKDGGLIVNPQRVGVVFSASKQLHVFRPKVIPNSWAGGAERWGSDLAQKIGARGPRLSPVAACATGSHAMAIGAQLIEDGYADVAICGAIEPVLTPLVLAAYDNMGALSKSGVMRPFDTKRDGFVPNVGAGCLILENEEKARKRGAQVLGYLSGWAMNADATHMTAMCPGGDSIARAIEYSMHRANVTNIDYINAHGTATKLNDETEARGICSALGNKVAVSSTKALTGHLLGAAGAVEAVISLLALRENFAPPTLNLEDADSECDLNLVIGQGRDLEIKSALSLNYGFGGHIGALLFEKA